MQIYEKTMYLKDLIREMMKISVSYHISANY